MVYCEVCALLNDPKFVYNVYYFRRPVIQDRAVITTRLLITPTSFNSRIVIAAGRLYNAGLSPDYMIMNL